MEIMINSDPNLSPYLDEYLDEYDFNFNDGFILMPSSSKEAIRALLFYKTRDEKILNNKNLLSAHLIEEFKKTDCYKSKSEKEQEEIIVYLKNNPKPDLDIKKSTNDNDGEYVDI